MRLDALLWYVVAYLLVLLRLLCSAEASQWLQQRVQVLVKSLQVQQRQWGARRAASQQQQQRGEEEEEEGGDAEEGGAGDAGRAGGGSAGAAGRSSLAGRLLRQYTGPDAPAPLRRLKQRFLSALSTDSAPPAPPAMKVQRDPRQPAEPSGASSSSASDEASSSEPADASASASASAGASASASASAVAAEGEPSAGGAGAGPAPRPRLPSAEASLARELAPIEEAGEGADAPPPAPAPAPAARRPARGPPPPSIVLQHADAGGAASPPPPPLPLSAASPVGSPGRSPAALQPLKLRPPPAGGGDDSAAPARKSPVTVQEWVDSLPAALTRSEEETEEQVLEDGEEALDLGLGAEAGLLYNGTPVVTVISPQQLRTVPPAENKFIRRDGLAREPSVQSDVTSHGSHGSSVESYLESRKPDPEEVLLSLGFGGPVSSLDSEVTRIPKRFLQPSKVKGVAIKDFLRHQQELIENFETGFCGYRGLSGASGAMPSVIVAKIMEKLREHERDSVHSTGTSEYAGLVTTPPPEVGRRFSHHSSLHHQHHHRHMLKRGSAPSSSSPSPSSRQNASLSVLNADNRRFLESQGSKSPEVPRKRMIIGQRSFTFGRDGDLIELESPSASSREDSSLGPVPLPPLKPLVHKDSVLSSATDLSLTSVDSDSDTDERSGSYELHRRLRIPLPQSPLPVLDSGQIHSSTPYSENLSSSAKISSFPEFETEKLVGTPTHRPLGIGKRMSSTSLSSWESDANSSPILVENSHGRAKFSVGDPEEHRHKSSHSLLGNLPIRYESIEEDVEMKTESDVSKESSFPLPSTSEDSKSNDGLVFNVQTECSNEETQENKQESDDCVFTLSQPSCPTSKVPISDEVTSAQGRRGSLKRQQNVAEEDALELISDSSPGCQRIECGSECNNDGNPKSEDVCLEKLSILCDNGCESTDPNRKFDNDPELLNSEHNCTESEDGLSDFEGIILPQLEIIDECLFKKDNVNSAEIHENGMGHLPLSDVDVHSCSGDTGLEVAEGNELVIASPHLQVSRDLRGDSFEMEEIGNGEDEAKIVTLTRARSDSSGFLDGDIERSENSESKAWEKHKTVENERSANVNSTLDVLADVNIEPRLRGGSTGTIVPDSENSVEKCDVGSFTKRLSLPVVCVIDESGGLLHSRSNSVHSESSDDTNSSGSGNVKKSHRRRTRRIHSAPEPLALTSSCSSVSNMFSSCSDESVIHIDLKAQCTPIQPTAEGIASTFRASKDLQELLEELAVRGVNLPQEFDSPSFSSQPSSQCAPLQADAVRAALNTYSSHLGESMSTLQANSELLECVVEARRELEIVRYIREQIASELRRVASLLEEQPGPRAAAITRQMTVLLREQTRLCRQLEALAQGYGSVDSSFTIDSIPRTFSAPSTVTTVPCCNSERLLGAVREENRRLERLVQGHSQELAEIRLLLKELVSKQN